MTQASLLSDGARPSDKATILGASRHVVGAIRLRRGRWAAGHALFRSRWANSQTGARSGTVLLLPLLRALRGSRPALHPFERCSRRDLRARWSFLSRRSAWDLLGLRLQSRPISQPG